MGAPGGRSSMCWMPALRASWYPWCVSEMCICTALNSGWNKQVSTAAQAKSVVAAARFPPKGIRGFGSPFTQTTWGVSVADYLATANDGIVVMTQVETVDAVKNLDEILSVDGLGKHARTETRDTQLRPIRRRVYWTIRPLLGSRLPAAVPGSAP